jgi:hypothetical protein
MPEIVFAGGGHALHVRLSKVTRSSAAGDGRDAIRTAPTTESSPSFFV